MKNHMNKLIQQVTNANIAYANGVPYLTDDEYHKLWQELYAIDPENPNLYHTSQGPKAALGNHKHLFQIFSPMKAFDSLGLKTFLERFKNDTLILEPKYDGLGAVLSRNPDGYVKLTLHGDGLIGRDISHHLNKLQGVDDLLALHHQSCEIIITNKDWEPEMGANQRNVASGLINSGSILHDNILTLVSHDKPRHYTELEPPHEIEKLEQTLLGYYSGWKDTFPIDGIMMKVKSPQKRLLAAHTDQYYLWSIAWKPPISTEWTTVVDIKWNVSRTGRLVPTIQYAPVKLCGTINQYVTGNNAQWILERTLKIGDKILIGKAGEIIPQVLRTSSQSITLAPCLPVMCPMCSNEVTWQGRDLICNANDCMGIFVKTLQHFYSQYGVDLKGFKEARFTILLSNRKIYEALRKSIWALLDPHTFDILNEIYNTIGTKLTDQYLAEIDVINDAKDPQTFIAALGYPGIGKRTAQNQYKIYSENPNDPALRNEFLSGLVMFKQAQLELKNFKFLPPPEEPIIHYSITGELSARREDIISYLTKHRWMFQASVSRRTSILILGNLKHRKLTHKLHEARERDVPIISEDQLDAVVKAVNIQHLKKEKE